MDCDTPSKFAECIAHGIGVSNVVIQLGKIKKFQPKIENKKIMNITRLFGAKYLVNM